MNEALNTVQELEDTNIVPFSRPPVPKPGGKPPDGVKDWLSGMASGTWFLTNVISQPHLVLQEWTHAGVHSSGAVMLFQNNTPQEQLLFYDPMVFCATFEFKGYIKEPVQQVEGDSNGSDLSRSGNCPNDGDGSREPEV